MTVKGLTFTRPDGEPGITKYLRLWGDIYFVDLEALPYEAWGDAIRVVIDMEGLVYNTCRFFLVQTHVAFPNFFSPGNFQTVRMSSCLAWDKRVCVLGVLEVFGCPEEVRVAFAEEIWQTAQESYI